MNKQDIKYENRDICKKCGGYCCRKSGCDYFVSDFESMKYEYLENILNTGRVSIVASFDFKRIKNGKLIYIPLLSLRARNTNRDIVDLLSFKTRCASLEENGCYYDIENRPGGGVALIPCSNKPCYSEVDRIEELKKWKSYQKVLEKLVKKYANMTVSEKIKEDVENILYNFYTGNYSDSLQMEIDDVEGMIPLLIECFPEEYLKTILKINNPSTKVKIRRK